MARASRLPSRRAPTRRTAIRATDRIGRAATAILRDQSRRMLSHEPGVRRDEDSEDLHQMRVAARRMRAAVQLLDGALPDDEARSLRRALRRTGRALSSVRDLDVLSADLAAYARKQPPAVRSSLASLEEAIRDERALARARMLLFMESELFADLHRDLAARTWTARETAVHRPGDGGTTPVREALPGLVRRALDEVRERGLDLGPRSIEDHHRLRISLKRLRYLLEFFQGALGGRAGGIVTRLKEMQDELGRLHDSATACAMVSRILNGWEERRLEPGAIAAPDPSAAAGYLASRYAERHRRLAAAREAWARCDLDEWERRLRTSFSAVRKTWPARPPARPKRVVRRAAPRRSVAGRGRRRIS